MNDLDMRRRESVVTWLKVRDNEKVHVIDNTRQRFIHINQFNQIMIIILFDSIFKRMYYLGTAADLLK